VFRGVDEIQGNECDMHIVFFCKAQLLQPKQSPVVDRNLVMAYEEEKSQRLFVEINWPDDVLISGARIEGV